MCPAAVVGARHGVPLRLTAARSPTLLQDFAVPVVASQKTGLPDR